MIVSLIVAMDEQGGIGLRGGIPWHLSTDLKRFKSLTMGHHLIMGRKTFASIGKPLPGRTTIILSRDPNTLAPGCLVAHTLEEALEIAARRGETEAFIIGGSQIYAQALEIADRIYLSEVHAVVETDVGFPQLELKDWTVQESTNFPASDRDEFAHTFKILEKNVGRS